MNKRILSFVFLLLGLAGANFSWAQTFTVNKNPNFANLPWPQSQINGQNLCALPSNNKFSGNFYEALIEANKGKVKKRR